MGYAASRVWKTRYKKRREFVNELNEIIQDIHSNISGGREKLILKYEPSIDDIFFEDELLKARSRDLKLCQTTVGPHRDDMLFQWTVWISENTARRVSRGRLLSHSSFLRLVL